VPLKLFQQPVGYFPTIVITLLEIYKLSSLVTCKGLRCVLPF